MLPDELVLLVVLVGSKGINRQVLA